MYYKIMWVLVMTAVCYGQTQTVPNFMVESEAGISQRDSGGAPPCPPYITQVQKSGNDAVLRWKGVRTDTLGNPTRIKNYIVFRDTSASYNPDSLHIIGFVPRKESTYVDEGILVTGLDYYYLVIVVDMSDRISRASNMAYVVHRTVNEDSMLPDKNWISLPWHSGYGTVSDLSRDVSPQGKPLTKIANVRSDQLIESWMWRVTPPVWTGIDFSITPGRAYEAIAMQDSFVLLVGSNNPQGRISLNKSPGRNGRNWVSIPYDVVYQTVSDITDEFSPAGDPVWRFTNLNDNQVYQSYIYFDLFAQWGGWNFAIAPGYGCEFWMTRDAIWDPTEHSHIVFPQTSAPERLHNGIAADDTRSMLVRGGGAPHLMTQKVVNWPEGYHAQPACHWVNYRHESAHTHHNNDASIGCWTDDYALSHDVVWWNSEVSNWANGQDPFEYNDIAITLGSWDPAYNDDSMNYGNNPDHIGYYWINSTRLDVTQDPQFIQPDDTLRIMPQPTACFESPYMTVSVQNPPQTLCSEGYDILGYWLIVNAVLQHDYGHDDTLPRGAPNDFTTVIGYFPQTGGPDTTTEMIYNFSDYFEGAEDGNRYETYHTYYLIARPETTEDFSKIPGFSTVYLSQNSNLEAGISWWPYRSRGRDGIAVDTEFENIPTGISVSPNFLTHHTNFNYSLGKKTRARITVHDAAGRLVRVVLDEVKLGGRHTIEFDATGLASGVYFIQLVTDSQKNVRKAILLR